MHFSKENNYDDDMGVLSYLVRAVPGLLPVSGSIDELNLSDPELDLEFE